MRTSATGSDALARQRGLTLVELLVVIAIMALLGAVVVATLPSRTSEAERAARAFASRLPALGDDAVTQGRPLGLDIKDGVVTLAHGPEGWAPLTTEALPEGVRATIDPADELLPPDPPPRGTLIVYRPPGEREETPPPPPPPVAFWPTGESTAFTARFEGEERWMVLVDADGRAEVRREDR